jgi:hypothetical protein
MFGVFAWGCPPMQPTQSFRSSMAISRMSGFPSPAEAVVARHTHASTTRILFISVSLLQRVFFVDDCNAYEILKRVSP